MLREEIGTDSPAHIRRRLEDESSNNDSPRVDAVMDYFERDGEGDGSHCLGSREEGETPDYDNHDWLEENGLDWLEYGRRDGRS